MTITVDELRTVARVLFERLEERGHSTVEIGKDYYWEVDRDQRYNVDAEPKKLAVGQLTEDWSNLKDIVSNPDERVVYGFTWLAPILREIGESIVD